MAGNYPNVPSWRMAWDTDGTQFFYTIDAGAPVESPSGAVVLNNEDVGEHLRVNPGFYGQSYGHGSTTQFLWIFPELRDIHAMVFGEMAGSFSAPPSYATTFRIDVSSNTTNGLDGTWVNYIPNGSAWSRFADKSYLRTELVNTSALGVKAIRLEAYAPSNALHYLVGAHFYGDRVSGETPQRLEIWHPTLDQKLGASALDWGNVPRNTVETRSFRIKNMHSTLNANSVRAAMSILTDTSPSVVGQLSISQDGGSTWAAQQTLSDPLAPGAISPVLQIRRNTASNATLSLWWSRVFADAASWS